MIVVADTSPLNYLILTGYIDLLPSLYGSVLIPPAVREEMSREGAPPEVRGWISQPPHWLEIHAPLTETAPQLFKLGSGEKEAIRIALEVRPTFLIMDEVQGRRVARRLGLPVIGTLGLLKEASQNGLTDLHTALHRLQATSFNLTPDLLRSIEE